MRWPALAQACSKKGTFKVPFLLLIGLPSVQLVVAWRHRLKAEKA